MSSTTLATIDPHAPFQGLLERTDCIRTFGATYLHGGSHREPIREILGRHPRDPDPARDHRCFASREVAVAHVRGLARQDAEADLARLDGSVTPTGTRVRLWLARNWPSYRRHEVGPLASQAILAARRREQRDVLRHGYEPRVILLPDGLRFPVLIDVGAPVWVLDLSRFPHERVSLKVDEVVGRSVLNLDDHPLFDALVRYELGDTPGLFGLDSSDPSTSKLSGPDDVVRAFMSEASGMREIARMAATLTAAFGAEVPLDVPILHAPPVPRALPDAPRRAALPPPEPSPGPIRLLGAPPPVTLPTEPSAGFAPPVVLDVTTAQPSRPSGERVTPPPVTTEASPPAVDASPPSDGDEVTGEVTTSTEPPAPEVEVAGPVVGPEARDVAPSPRDEDAAPVESPEHETAVTFDDAEIDALRRAMSATAFLLGFAPPFPGPDPGPDGAHDGGPPSHLPSGDDATDALVARKGSVPLAEAVGPSGATVGHPPPDRDGTDVLHARQLADDGASVGAPPVDGHGLDGMALGHAPDASMPIVEAIDGRHANPPSPELPASDASEVPVDVPTRLAGEGDRRTDGHAATSTSEAGAIAIETALFGPGPVGGEASPGGLVTTDEAVGAAPVEVHVPPDGEVLDGGYEGVWTGEEGTAGGIEVIDASPPASSDARHVARTHVISGAVVGAGGEASFDHGDHDAPTFAAPATAPGGLVSSPGRALVPSDANVVVVPGSLCVTEPSAGLIHTEQFFMHRVRLFRPSTVDQTMSLSVRVADWLQVVGPSGDGG